MIISTHPGRLSGDQRELLVERLARALLRADYPEEAGGEMENFYWDRHGLGYLDEAREALAQREQEPGKPLLEYLARLLCERAGLDPERKFKSSDWSPGTAPHELAWHEFQPRARIALEG